MFQNNDGSIEKLRQILASRYQKNFELRQLIELNPELSEGEGFCLKGQDLLIPLRVKNAFLGTAVVEDGADLENEKHLQIAQIVRMVLEPALYRDYLDRRESNLRILSESTDLPTDNLSLFGEPEIAADPFLHETNLKRPKLVSNLLHLHAHDSQRLKKAALLLHEMTERWAFIPYSDLDGGLHSIEDIVRLGALTVYIESVEKLPGHVQELLVAYAAAPHSPEEPLIVTSSSCALEDLESMDELTIEFREELLSCALELDRTPLTERGLREVLALMFFEAQGRS